MSIPWLYLNFRSATEAVLRDYNNMKYIVDNTDEKIKSIREDMSAVHSPSWDGMPKIFNPNANEEKLMNAIDEIDMLQERYRQAIEYMNWFLPAWNHLTEEERFMLHEFYMSSPEDQLVARYTIAEHFNIDESYSYRKKNRALQKLTTLLYGKN